MFAWKLILAMLLNQSPGDVVVIPANWLPEGGPRLLVTLAKGDPAGDYAEAARVWTDDYTITTECRVTININSVGWRFSGRQDRAINSTAPLIMYLKDGTRDYESGKTFLLAHEFSHCFDNEMLPVDSIGGEGYRVWKEIFADSFASMVVLNKGITNQQIKYVAGFRGHGAFEPYGSRWEESIKSTTIQKIEGKTDEELLNLSFKIRKEMWVK